LVAYDLKGKPQREVSGKVGRLLAVSPSLNKLWFAGRDGNLPETTPFSLRVREIDDKTEGKDLGIESSLMDIVSPDGKTVGQVRRISSVGTPTFENKLVDIATGKWTKLALPENQQLFGISPDGKWVLALEYNLPQKDGSPPLRLHQFILKDGKTRLLTGALNVMFGGRISPDGNKVLMFACEKSNKEKWYLDGAPYVVDVATLKALRLPRQEKQSFSCGVWSPDSGRIAYAWRAHADREPYYSDGIAPTRLVICDADGKNAETIFSAAEMFFPVAWW
jgi:hypothetical protein